MINRDPTLHIKLSDLTLLLGQIGIDQSQTKDKAEKLLYLAQKMQIRGLYQIQTTAGKKKALKTKIDSSINTDDFNLLLYQIRELRKHRGIKQLFQTDREYTTMKKVATIAEEFCKEFEFEDRKQGLRRFIEIGLDIMNKKYSLNLFITYREKIYELYQCEFYLRKDTDKKATLSMYQWWTEEVAKQIGRTREFELLINSVKTDPAKYITFYYARTEADSKKIRYDYWMRSQFEQLSFLNSLPELNQLHGQPAMMRYLKWKAGEKIQEN